MDRAYVEEVARHLGARYRLGPAAQGGVELLYRAGRAEFRPTRFAIGTGPSGRGLALAVDVRLPRGTTAAEAEALVEAFDAGTARPRGLTRAGDTSAAMSTELGAESGSVRTLEFVGAPADAAEAARHIRAIVESVDLPIIAGIHEPEHVVARDPPPPREKPRRRTEEPMEPWEYQLDGGLLGSLVVVVDPNTRTLRVFERRLLSRRELGEVLKLASVARFEVRSKDKGAELVAIRRTGEEVTLASGSGSADFVATARRLAGKVMIPFGAR